MTDLDLDHLDKVCAEAIADHELDASQAFDGERPDLWDPPTAEFPVASIRALLSGYRARGEALAYLGNGDRWFGEQRFAEDTDADFLLRVLRASKAYALAALSLPLKTETR